MWIGRSFMQVQSFKALRFMLYIISFWTNSKIWVRNINIRRLPKLFHSRIQSFDKTINNRYGGFVIVDFGIVFNDFLNFLP